MVKYLVSANLQEVLLCLILYYLLLSFDKTTATQI